MEFSGRLLSLLVDVKRGIEYGTWGSNQNTIDRLAPAISKKFGAFWKFIILFDRLQERDGSWDVRQ